MDIHVLKTDTITKGDRALVEKRLPLRYEKALRFRHESDRLRSTAAGLLMLRHLPLRDGSDLVYGKQGKPCPEGLPCLEGKVFFNLSHSGDYAVLAVSDRETGVDIETVSDRPLKLLGKSVKGPEADLCMSLGDAELKELLETSAFGFDLSDAGPFSAGQIRPFEQGIISPKERATILWTRRECVMKAFGEGLSMYEEITDTGLEAGGIMHLRGRSCRLVSYLIPGYCLSVCELDPISCQVTV